MSSQSHVSRRAVVGGAAAVLGGGTLALVDDLAGGVQRAEAASTASLHDEQYLVDGLETISDNGVRVVVPPLYKYIITGRLRRDVTWTAKSLQKAQAKLEKALQQVEKGRSRTAAGLTVVVAWGLPYFRERIRPAVAAGRWDAVWPRVADRSQDAVIDAVRFPSDPSQTTLEGNDLMVMIRSDSLVTLGDVKGKLFHDSASDGYLGDIIDVTSERTGFVGRGFGRPSIGRALAIKAGVPGAGSIPATSQLMMGFTSTQQAALGPGNIASFETLGLTTVRPGDYFAGGSALHLSHIYEDLAAWYAKSYGERLHRMISPRATAGEGTVTVPNGPAEVSTHAQVVADGASAPGGHNALLQQATRLGTDVVDVYGTRHPQGTPVPVREDFNTLDAPFSSSGAPQNRPGLHFVVFVPASGRFHAARLAMDGVLPDGTTTGSARSNGINDVLTTTHRQNYLVPPRAHRSFPLAELLS